MNLPIRMNYTTVDPRLTRQFPASQNIDENDPREPPPPATPLQFPSYAPTGLSESRLDGLDVSKLFANIARTGARPTHTNAFGLTFTSDVSLDALLPTDFLPPTDWLTEPALTEGSDFTNTPPQTQLLSNGSVIPDHKIFYSIIKELQYDNGDAFRAARRQTQPAGRPNIRVSRARRFWMGLADMAQYWDTSLDQYHENLSENNNEAMDIDEIRSVAQNTNQSKANDKRTYTGRRTDTGAKMPSRHREETVMGFIETVIWSFSCTLEKARMQPRVQIHGVKFELPNTHYAYRAPQDHRKARAGVREGPLFGVFLRNVTKFREPGQLGGEGSQEIGDLLREAGLMLMLAQKRAREGKTEVLPGAGKWWAAKPRWGGGPGGAFGQSEGLRAPQQPQQQQLMKRQKKTQAEVQEEKWRKMSPPESTWEKMITYQAIGKVEGSPYDDIYFISSLNHHISILHLRIHTNYTDYISDSEGKSKYPNATKQPWFELKMERSKWFDLFNADDRVEAMRGIWAVMNYLMREDEGAEDAVV